MSRLLTPRTSGTQAEVGDPGDLLVVVDLDEGLEPPLVGGGVEADQRLVVEEADGEEDGVGPAVDRLVEVALGRGEVLAEDGDRHQRPDRADDVGVAAEVDQVGHHRQAGDGGGGHDGGQVLGRPSAGGGPPPWASAP